MLKMITPKVVSIIGILIVFLASCNSKDNLKITDAWIRATPPSHNVSAAYLTIENLSNRSRELISIDTPAADSTELHIIQNIGDVMEMQNVKSLRIPPRGKLEMNPGGTHLMLFGMRKGLGEGDSVVLSLYFADNTIWNVEARVLKKRR